MNACKVKGCPGDGDFLIRFPPTSDKLMFSLWIKSCRLDPLDEIDANARVCSLHFIDSDFDSTSKWLMSKKALMPKTHPWKNLDLGFRECVEEIVCCVRGCPSRAAEESMCKFPAVHEPLFQSFVDACTQNGEKRSAENFARAHVCRRHFLDGLDGGGGGGGSLLKTVKPSMVGIPRLGLVTNISICCCVPNCRTMPSCNVYSCSETSIFLVAWPVHSQQLLLKWYEVFDSVLDRERLDVGMAKVCLKHFPMSQFVPVGKKMEGIPARRKAVLTRDAVPMYEETPSKSSRKVEASDGGKCCIDNCLDGLGPFFAFPSQSRWQLRKQWVWACTMEGNSAAVNPDKDLVCVRHFAADDLAADDELHPTAVPEIFNVCMVRNCTSNRGGGGGGNRDNYFFGLPESKILRHMWFAALGITPVLGYRLECGKVCHLHFANSCFPSRTADRSVDKAYLRSGSVPSIRIDNGGGGRRTKNFNRVMVKRLQPIHRPIAKKRGRPKRIPTDGEQQVAKRGSLKPQVWPCHAPNQSVSVQVDTFKDLSTISCLSKIEFLQRVEARLDSEILTLEIENYDLLNRRAKIIFAKPVILK